MHRQAERKHRGNEVKYPCYHRIEQRMVCIRSKRWMYLCCCGIDENRNDEEIPLAHHQFRVVWWSLWKGPQSKQNSLSSFKYVNQGPNNLEVLSSRASFRLYIASVGAKQAMSRASSRAAKQCVVGIGNDGHKLKHCPQVNRWTVCSVAKNWKKRRSPLRKKSICRNVS